MRSASARATCARFAATSCSTPRASPASSASRAAIRLHYHACQSQPRSSRARTRQRYSRRARGGGGRRLCLRGAAPAQRLPAFPRRRALSAAGSLSTALDALSRNSFRFSPRGRERIAERLVVERPPQSPAPVLGYRRVKELAVELRAAGAADDPRILCRSRRLHRAACPARPSPSASTRKLPPRRATPREAGHDYGLDALCRARLDCPRRPAQRGQIVA